MKEKYAARNVRGKAREGRVSQIVWACFAGDILGPIAFIDTTEKQDDYISLLDQFLVPFIKVLNANGQTNLEFQQDNARPHVAKRTKDYLKLIAESHQLKVMEWPPNSPDMNPIENLWAHLKRELHLRYPDTMLFKGSPETIKATLRQRLNVVWQDIGRDVLRTLVESMPQRVHALLEAKGWYTKY